MSGSGGDRAMADLLLIAASAHRLDEAARAAAAVGARVVASLDLGSASDPGDWPGGADAVYADVSGGDPARIALVLDGAGDWCARGGRAVIVFEGAELDQVAAAMLGTGAQLLCAPTLAEAVAALSLAVARGAGGVREEGPESEAERLRRLNEEVARIAEVLARLSQGDRGGGGSLADARAEFRAAPAAPSASAAEVRLAIRARRLRDRFFDGGLFEDPAWDMLLDLFAADLEGKRVSVSSLCIAASVAPTTALRWIGKLSDAGLFERAPDPADRRRAFIALSADARRAMALYWQAVRRIGAEPA